MGAVVLPAFRGRGIYRALVAARLAHARSFGIELATGSSSKKGAGRARERNLSLPR